jgi:hypothetical protein
MQGGRTRDRYSSQEHNDRETDPQNPSSCAGGKLKVDDHEFELHFRDEIARNTSCQSTPRPDPLTSMDLVGRGQRPPGQLEVEDP